MVVLCVLWAGAVCADGKAHVPQTGQVLCYNSAGAVITCAGTGQDGALQKGVDFPTPRFTDKGNGTIKDNLTGLIWLKRADCSGALRTWQQALDDVAALNSTGQMSNNDCGDTSKKGTHQTDWRLPNIKELLSLVDYGFFQPALSNPAGTAQAQCLPVIDCPFSFLIFPDLGLSYWSSTSRFISPSEAWQLLLTEGNATPEKKTSTLGPGVLAVRGGS